MGTSSLDKKVLVILGPTTTGKTDLGLSLAKKFDGELISADSRQVYKGLDIGTGKYPNGQRTMDNGQLKKGKGFWEIEGVKIWMYDVADPSKQYNVARFAKDAGKIIDDIYKRGKRPILVGGTGLYIKAIVDGLPNLGLQVNLSLRKKIENLSKEDLQIKLQKASPDRWERMNYSDRQNPRRLVRAIELETSPRRSQSHLRGGLSYETLKIGLIAKREVLYKKSDERVLSRIEQGMVEETKRLHNAGLTFARMKQLGLEYGVLADYLSKEIKNEDELIKVLQGKIHGYVRRQLTYFKKEKNVNWFDITKEDFEEKMEKLIFKWYHQSDAKQD